MTRSIVLASLFLGACGLENPTTTDTATPAKSSGSYSWGTSHEEDPEADSTDTGETDTVDSDDTDVDDTDISDTDDTGVPCTPVTWYRDEDADGYGDASSWTLACEQPTGYVANDDDLDDSINAVHDTPTPVQLCAYADLDVPFDLWVADVTTGTYGSQWGTKIATEYDDVCELVADFRPGYLYGMNGWFMQYGDQFYLAEAGNRIVPTAIYAIFPDGSQDIYSIDEPGMYLGDAGYASFESNGIGGGNIIVATNDDFSGNYIP